MPLSVSSVLSLLTGAQNSQAGGALDNGAGGFMSLLDTMSGGSDSAVADNSNQTDALLAADNNAPISDPISSPVHVPSVLFANHQSVSVTQNDPMPRQNFQQAPDATQEVENHLTPVVLHATATPHTSSHANRNPHDNNDNSNNTTDTTQPQVLQAPATQDAGATQQADTQVSDDSSTPAPKQLDDLNQILAMLAQVLAGITLPPAPVVQTGGDTSGNAVANDTASDGNSPAQSSNASPNALLSDIQNILQQLQTMMQGGDAQQAPITDALAADVPAGDPSLADTTDKAGAFQTLLSSLAKDLTQLSTLMTPAPLPATSDTVSQNVDASSNAPNAPDNALKNLISGVLGAAKNLLVKPSQNQAAPLQQAVDQNNIVPQVNASLAAQLKDWLQSHKPSTDNAPDKISDVTSILPSAAPKLNVDIPQIALPAIALSAGTSDSGTGNSGNSEGNDNSQQPIITPPVANSAQASSGGAPVMSFAKVLDQMSNTSSSLTDQVTFQIKTAVADGSSKITIQLSPEDLGKLDIKLEVGADGKTGNITITADNKNTLDLLQKDAGGLQRALSDAGLNMNGGSMNFNLRQGQQDAQNGSAQAAMNYQKAAPEDEEAEVLAPGIITGNYVVNITEGLDIRI